MSCALIGEFSADDIVGVEIADHPAAAVKEHQTGREAVRLPQRPGRVDACRDVPSSRLDRQRLDGFQQGRFGIGDEASLPVIFARLGRRQRLVGRSAGILEGLVDKGGIGIEDDWHQLDTLGSAWTE